MKHKSNHFKKKKTLLKLVFYTHTISLLLQAAVLHQRQRPFFNYNDNVFENTEAFAFLTLRMKGEFVESTLLFFNKKGKKEILKSKITNW